MKARLSLLLTLLVANVLLLLALLGRPALAGVRAVLDTLGPAEAVLLSGEEGEDPLAVENRDGRIAWADPATHRVYSVGFVNLNRILPKVMETGSYVEERTALEQELQARQEELMAEQQALQTEMGGMTPDSPGAPDAQARANDWVQRFQRFQQEAMTRIDELNVTQIERAYRDVTAAVEVVADEMDVDLMHRYVPASDPFQATTAAAAMAEIRSRPFLRHPDGLDLTDAVLEEMALATE